MTNVTYIDWKKIRADLGNGFGKSVSAVKKGAIVAGRKAEELAEGGQRQFRVMLLKSKIKDSYIELGVRVFALSGNHAKNPLLDEKVKEVVANIRMFESQISDLENEHRTAPRAEKKHRASSLKKAA